jgi:hypothetical protein
MIRLRALVVLSCLVLASALVQAQELGQYRDVRLGSNLVTVATANGLTPANARVIHRRPSTMQDLEWRPPFLGGSGVGDDPVREITFSFYDDQLFRIVVNYNRQRTEGLTDTDLIGALTAVYGPPAALGTVKPRASESARDLDQGTVIARWESADASVTLLRARYPTPVSLVVLSKRLDDLARTASTEAIRLDLVEEPQRESDRRQKEANAARAAEEAARPTNRAGFKP